MIKLRTAIFVSNTSESGFSTFLIELSMGNEGFNHYIFPTCPPHNPLSSCLHPSIEFSSSMLFIHLYIFCKPVRSGFWISEGNCAYLCHFYEHFGIDIIDQILIAFCLMGLLYRFRIFIFFIVTFISAVHIYITTISCFGLSNCFVFL